MSVINGDTLLDLAPIRPVMRTKETFHGTSYGLSEAGIDIRLKQDILLHPFKRFSLASSFEYFVIPNNLVAIIHDKSSLIRQGLMVGNSVAEPGWKGFLTLELFYFGWMPLKLRAGMGIAQVIFHELKHPAQYVGKYDNQPDRPVAAILS